MRGGTARGETAARRGSTSGSAAGSEGSTGTTATVGLELPQLCISGTPDSTSRACEQNLQWQSALRA